MLPDYFQFSLPTQVVYGIGITNQLAEPARSFGRRKAILITGKVLRKAGPVAKVQKGFLDTDIRITCIFDDVPPNSTIDTVNKCAALGKKHKCNLVIAVGGGSVLDTAKVANLLIVKGGKPEDHMGAYLLGQNESLLPAIFFPTTAGTGSEVTRVAVIADPGQDVKLPFTEEQFLPSLAILDPELTVSMPGKLTAATGMDALTHAIEAYVDKEWSPASDALALHAIRLISRHILGACADPGDLTARGAMLVGSFLAGVAFSHSMVGMVHGISHALGGVYHIPHGLANALVLPEVMAYNLPHQRERYADIAGAMGIAFPQLIDSSRSLVEDSRLGFFRQLPSSAERIRDWIEYRSNQARSLAAKAIDNFDFIDSWIRKQAATAAVEKIHTLNRQLAYLTGLPLNLKDAGIDDKLARLGQVADTAMEDGAMLYNPVEPTRKTVVRIVKKIYHQQIKPLPVTEDDLKTENTGHSNQQIKNVFKDSRMLYDVLLGFYEYLKKHPEIGPAIHRTGLSLQFIYHHPEGTITIDASGKVLSIVKGPFKDRPEVTMTMDADFAHRFWHGRVNLISALTRHQVKAKGNIPKILRLLPILKPAYDLYPKYLRDRGFEKLIIADD
jgi:alcohol dehydrogenase class IV